MKVLSPLDCYLELPSENELGGGETFFDLVKSAELYASGRSALCAAFPFLKKSGIKTIFLPELICPSLPIFFKRFFEVKTYSENHIETLSLKASEAILFMDFFGASNQAEIEGWILKNPQTFSILDATFAPFSEWATNSAANCVFASLRKLLPLPDGAYLKLKGEKPRQIAVLPSTSMPDFAGDILSAMTLKTIAKKAGGIEDKAYRKLFMKGEEKLFNSNAVCRISPFSFEMLKKLDIPKILKNRANMISDFEKSENIKKLNCKTILPRDGKSAFSPAIIIENETDFELARKMFATSHNRPAAYWNKPDFNF